MELWHLQMALTQFEQIRFNLLGLQDIKKLSFTAKAIHFLSNTTFTRSQIVPNEAFNLFRYNTLDGFRYEIVRFDKLDFVPVKFHTIINGKFAEDNVEKDWPTPPVLPGGGLIKPKASTTVSVIGEPMSSEFIIKAFPTSKFGRIEYTTEGAIFYDTDGKEISRIGSSKLEELGFSEPDRPESREPASTESGTGQPRITRANMGKLAVKLAEIRRERELRNK